MMTAQNITSKHIECLLLPPRLPANTSLLVALICPISTHDPMQITVAMITVEDCPAIYMIHSVGVSRESASTIEGKVSIVSCQLQIHLHSSFLVVSRLNWSMAISRWSEKGLKSQIFPHPVWGLFVELSCVVCCDWRGLFLLFISIMAWRGWWWWLVVWWRADRQRLSIDLAPMKFSVQLFLHSPHQCNFKLSIRIMSLRTSYSVKSKYNAAKWAIFCLLVSLLWKPKSLIAVPIDIPCAFVYCLPSVATISARARRSCQPIHHAYSMLEPTTI